jgi:hypothetical protein
MKASIVLLLFFLLLFFALFSEPTFPQEELLPPAFLSAKSDQNERVPLFWFNSNPDTTEIRYHREGMFRGMYVSSVWHENCVGVRITSNSSPFYLLESRIYLSHSGVPSDTSYNYHAPFFVTVNQDSGGIPRSIFLDSVSTFAQSADSLSAGEWAEVTHGLLMTDSAFWIVLHWNEASPMSPLVGVDSSVNIGNSFCGKRLFLHREWYPCDYNLMIDAVVVTNSKKDSQANKYRVYRSQDSSSVINTDNLIAAVPASHFQFTDWDMAIDQTYFYRVTSFNSSEESSGSNLAKATPKIEAQLKPGRKRIYVFLDSAEWVIENLVLTNPGGLPLWYELGIAMQLPEWMGGSDQWGYNWTDNRFKPDLLFDWVNIEERGIRIGTAGDDNKDYGFFPLGFSFPFYDSTFDSIMISSDGWLSFSPVISCYDDSFYCYKNKSLPYLWGPYNLVAPFWDDLKLTDSSAIYFYSSANSAVISYLNMYHYGQAGRGPYTFQTILFPDGEITFQYLHIDDSLYNATVGMQNEDGTVGLDVSYNQNFLRDSLVVKMQPGWVRLSSMEGAIQPGGNELLNLTFDASKYPRGVYQADLLIDGWDKNHQLEPLAIPLTLCIDTIIDTMTSSVAEELEKPEKIALFQNYPNPFNPVTRIQYMVEGRGKAAVGGRWTGDSSIPTTLKIYNVLGQRVKTLVDEPQKPGDYEVVWDGKDDEGNDVASGIYFCKLTAGSYQKTKKMILLR